MVIGLKFLCVLYTYLYTRSEEAKSLSRGDGALTREVAGANSAIVKCGEEN